MPKHKVTIPTSSACVAAFQNESEVITINGLSIENRLERVQIHGEIDITRDKTGLENIMALKRQVDCIAAQLKSEDLPERVKVIDTTIVNNPFK